MNHGPACICADCERRDTIKRKEIANRKLAMWDEMVSFLEWHTCTQEIPLAKYLLARAKEISQ